ncbi:glycosyltransferase family 1 protein [Siminovitchia sediminis]|uniref:Glycosyltransferase family 1 protein n=1 Tax=Siminovitchia sediminis TaxID=1274353 RepID=A0ABW4KJ94_9BACI
MGSPIRVLHSVVNMNRGGAETFIMNVYRNIDRTKIQFDFLTCKPGVFDQEIERMGGKVQRIPYITDVGHYGYVKGLQHFFGENDYKVIHSHMDKMSGIVLREANKAGIPFRFAHIHSSGSEGNILARAYKWYSGKLLLKNATHFLACSKKAAEWIHPIGMKNTTIIKNGIDSESFTFSENTRKEVRKEFGIPHDSLVLGHVGRFSKVKNHQFLIDVFCQLSKKKENAVLFLVGDGPLRNQIEQKVLDLNVGHKVVFAGLRSDIHRLLQAFDLFLLPSKHEGLPVSVIEAQGAGLPCLISERISDEVDLNLGLIHYASLSDRNKWVEEMLRLTAGKLKRVNPRKAFLNKGYDITSSAGFLEGCYLSCSRRVI